MKEILDEKESRKNKLIGKSEIFIEDIKKLGFKDVSLARKAFKIKIKDLEEKKKAHTKKVNTFQNKFGDLIND